jgi:Sulfatase
MSDRLSTGLSRVIAWLPALVLGLLCQRAGEVLAAWPALDGTGSLAQDLPSLLLHDLLALLRWWPALALACLPWSAPAAATAGRRVFGFLCTVLLLAQGLLIQYSLTAGAPLGADLFAYSLADIRQAMAGSISTGWTGLSTLLAVALCWTALWRLPASSPLPRWLPGLLLLACLGSWLAAPAPAAGDAAAQDRPLRVNKLSHFTQDSLRWAWRSLAGGRGEPVASNQLLGFAVSDPAYPFLHEEQTPDVLGEQLRLDPRRPPDLVFVLVEGLGRSFSGPDARLGSFTPFLDELADQSLYFENFLAPQGRTFGVLPAVFGALPFGKQGYLELPDPLPAHHSLLAWLGQHGHHTRFISGTEARFDRQDRYLAQVGVAAVLDRSRVGPRAQEANEWGHDDRWLLEFALRTARPAPDTPRVDVIQTISMHPPYRFPEQTRWRQRVEQRLDSLGVPAQQRGPYRARRDVFASILFVDDALRRYFAAVRRDPAWANTIFVITGDHRLIEFPPEERIERYHVPLLIHSPLLRAPRRIKAVSSHLDITPSLVAMFSHRYGWERPSQSAWLGSGLDLAPQFRNLHEIPIQQTKTELADFVAGTVYLAHDQAYRLADGLQARPLDDPALHTQVQRRFAAFRAANQAFAANLSLLPDAALAATRPYATAGAAAPANRPDTLAGSAAAGLQINEAQLLQGPDGSLTLELVLHYGSGSTDMTVVPLAVLQDLGGRELRESYGAAVRMTAGQSRRLQLPIDTRALPAGRYYLSVFPSDPQTGKRVGHGRNRMPVQIPAKAGQ